MSRIFDRNMCTALIGRGGSPRQSPFCHDRRTNGAGRIARSRGHDFDDDHPYDPLMDDDEDYDDFRWEEVPDNGHASPPAEFWDDDDWD